MKKRTAFQRTGSTWWPMAHRNAATEADAPTETDACDASGRNESDPRAGSARRITDLKILRNIIDGDWLTRGSANHPGPAFQQAPARRRCLSKDRHTNGGCDERRLVFRAGRD